MYKENRLLCMVSSDEVTFYYYRLEYKKETNYYIYNVCTVYVYFVLNNKIANKVYKKKKKRYVNKISSVRPKKHSRSLTKVRIKWLSFIIPSKFQHYGRIILYRYLLYF